MREIKISLTRDEWFATQTIGKPKPANLSPALQEAVERFRLTGKKISATDQQQQLLDLLKQLKRGI